MSRSALSALLGRRTYRRLASLDDEEQGAGLDGEASEEEQEMDEAFRGGDMSPSARSVSSTLWLQRRLRVCLNVEQNCA